MFAANQRRSWQRSRSRAQTLRIRLWLEPLEDPDGSANRFRGRCGMIRAGGIALPG